MPFFADFYFYKNTPMDANEVNFFNTGGTNMDMASELLRLLRDYQVGVEYNSKVPFNPTATEIYVNAFLNGGSGTPTIDDILAIDYMIVKSYDLHNRVHQEYKYFAYFVESIEPYMQTYPTDGLEDTGVKAAFGYSYRVKLKKDTFVTDFIFSTAQISLSDIFTDGLRVNVATPIAPFFDAKSNVLPSKEFYDNNFSFAPDELTNKNKNVTTIIQRKKSEYPIEEYNTNVYSIQIQDSISKYVAVAVFVSKVNDGVGLADSFVCANCPTGNLATLGVSLEEAINDALLFMRTGVMSPTGQAGGNEAVQLKSVYLLPSGWISQLFPFDPTVDHAFSAYINASPTTPALMEKIFKFTGNQWADTKIANLRLPSIYQRKMYGWEAENITLVAGRQRIEMPQFIFTGGYIFGEEPICEICLSNNDFGIALTLKAAGKVYDVTEEFSLPVLTAAGVDQVQREIAKTSSVLRGVVGVVGGIIATVGGFGAGNAAAGVAGLGAVVGGATSIAQGSAPETETGRVSVSGGNADAITAIKKGIVYFDIEPCANAVDILNYSQRYGYNFNGMHILNGSESIFSTVESGNYNFLYIEATVERFHDGAVGFSKNFKAWLAERMQNGIRIFYRFDDFFNKQRNQMGYLKV